MRNASCMSDYREVNHGYETLLAALSNQERREAFVSALDACVPGVASEALATFDRNWPQVRSRTYISSLSEHDAKEDFHGRLSMWRAFGSSVTRVALVAKIPWFSGAIAAMGASFSPVAYYRDSEVADELDAVIASIRENTEFLRREFPPPMVLVLAFTMLLTAVICVKHEGFSEEREWRAFYVPHWNTAAQVPIQHTVESVNGVPQSVYHLPLDATVSPAIADLDFSKVFDRLIIGPTQYPVAVGDAFVEALAAAGVENPASKVFASGIPIRT